MMGSTIKAGMTIIFITPKKIVTVWARVKADTCQIKGRSLVDNKNNPTTNKIWSKPLGTIC